MSAQRRPRNRHDCPDEQHPMTAQNEGEGRFWIACRSTAKPRMQKERLGDKEDEACGMPLSGSARRLCIV